jgi:hypothetical protein
MSSIDKIANYWAGFLTAPNNLDNAQLGDENDAIFAALRSMSRSDVSADQVEIFKESLRQQMTHDDLLWDLNVDYNPCRELIVALNAAGIKEAALPVKTWTYWDRDTGKVTASNGYGASIVEL